MKRLNSILGKLVLCVCETAVGVTLIINPKSFAAAVITILGVFLIAAGLFCIIRYFQAPIAEAMLKQNFVKGLCGLSAGAYCLFNVNAFPSDNKLMPMAFGTLVIFTGLIRIQWTVDMLRLKCSKWYIAALGALVSAGLGIVIIINPFGPAPLIEASTASEAIADTTDFFWRFTGASLIIEAAFDLIISIFVKVSLPEIKESEKIDVTDIVEAKNV